MDEKTLPLPAATRPGARTPHSCQAFIYHLLAVGLLFYLAYSTHEDLARILAIYESSSESAVAADVEPMTNHELIPLEAHIMSKCPDARDCLHDLVLPTMQRVYEKTNFTLSFIGRSTQDGVECKHGPAECMANIIELCASKLYPEPKIYLGFTMCLFRDYQILPDQSVVEDCALEHGIDIDVINECATRDDGAFGLDLLRQSVQHSADVGVSYSCTVRLDDKEYCIRDNGEWKACPAGAGVPDLVLAIEKLWRASASQ